MIQEIIPGPASNMYNYTVYINSESCISARFLRIKVRQDPPEFGITRVGISKNRVLEVEEFAEKLLKNLSLKGLLLPSIRRIQEMTSSNYWKLMQER
ncbi:MAG: ATP-grasp protein-like protein [Candidatus Dadabacteria bacterium]|jgi:predicted ATP-grasp superfamily ATP-dependent carboligase|nr:ATP-grasp protein-like protein [Candidatus Dadabacteria bacterium]